MRKDMCYGTRYCDFINKLSILTRKVPFWLKQFEWFMHKLPWPNRKISDIYPQHMETSTVAARLLKNSRLISVTNWAGKIPNSRKRPAMRVDLGTSVTRIVPYRKHCASSQGLGNDSWQHLTKSHNKQVIIER